MDSQLVYIQPIPNPGLPVPTPQTGQGFFAVVTATQWPVQPPGGGGGPIDPGAHPSHPIFYPPGTSPGYPGWGGSRPHPEFPIAGPPWFPTQPPPGGGEGGPPNVIGGGPILPPGTEAPGPIRPPAGQPPSEAPEGFYWLYTFIYGAGWMWVLIPETPSEGGGGGGTTPPPEGPPPGINPAPPGDLVINPLNKTQLHGAQAGGPVRATPKPNPFNR